MRKARHQSPAQTARDAMRALRLVAYFFALILLFASSASAQTIKLDSGWQFLADREGTARIGDLDKAQGWRDVRAGLSWNAQFADLRDYMGVAWYRAKIDLPQTRVGERVLLRFGAIDYFSEVFVNGQRVGSHEGGYTPF